MIGTTLAPRAVRRASIHGPRWALLAALLAAPPACGPAATAPAADLIVINGVVYPGGGAAVRHQALAVRGDRVAAVGTTAEIERLRGPSTQVIDAAGRAVVPGFNDTHVHLFEGGFAAARADLSAAGSPEEVQQMLRDFVAKAPGRPWLLGEGWRYNVFPGGLPTKVLLDAVSPDTPAFLRCFDYHTAWVNSKALALAGITRDTPDPPNGHIERDPRTGEPTGVLQESAQGLVSRLLPAPSMAERLTVLDEVTRRFHAAGVTSVQNALGTPDEFAAFDRARKDGRLALRVYSAVSPAGLFSSDPPPPITAAMVDGWDRLRQQYPADGFFKLGLVKLFVDGVIETHTATLLAPYANLPTNGPSNYTAAELTRIVTLLDGRGWQVLMHAVGDGAVRMALDAVEAAAAANPVPAAGRRHRIDHIETLDPADEGRFKTLGVVASMHPAGVSGPPRPRPVTAASVTSVWGTNLGPERAARGGGWKRIRDAGGRVVLGSDWPVAPFDASRRLFQVALSPPRSGRPDGRLSIEAAIDAYTSDAAYVGFDERDKGRLEAGMLADFVVLATDVFARVPTAADDLVPVITVFGGSVVYRREGAASP